MEAYHQYLLHTGLKDFTSIDGNTGVFLFKKEKDGNSHLYMLAFGNDWKAVKKFAGEVYVKARYYPQIKNFYRGWKLM